MADDTQEQVIREVAEKAADAAVQRIFLALGVDVTDPEAVIEMQESFAYLKRSREMSDLVMKYGVTTVITTVVGSALALLWLGLRGFFPHAGT